MPLKPDIDIVASVAAAAAAASDVYNKATTDMIQLYVTVTT